MMVSNVKTQTRTLPPLRTSSEVNCKVKGKMMTTPWLRRRDWGEAWRGWEDQRRLWVRRRKNQDLLPVRLKVMEYHYSCFDWEFWQTNSFPIPYFSIAHHHHYGDPILCPSKHKMGRALTGNWTPSTSSFFLTFSLFLHFNMESTQNHIFTPILTDFAFRIISHEQMFS